MNTTEIKRIWAAIQGDIFRLAGPRNATLRQAAMLALTGERLPKARCGVNAVSLAAFRVFNPPGNCRAVREDNLAEIVRNLP